MAVAAFVLALVVLFGNAAAIYWLYLRQNADKASRVHDVAEMEQALSGRIKILENRPVRLAPADPEKKPKVSRPSGWQAVRDELEAAPVEAAR